MKAGRKAKRQLCSVYEVSETKSANQAFLLCARVSDLFSHPHRRKGHFRPGRARPDIKGDRPPISPLSRTTRGSPIKKGLKSPSSGSSPLAEWLRKSPNPHSIVRQAPKNARGRIPRRCRQSRLAAALGHEHAIYANSGPGPPRPG